MTVRLRGQGGLLRGVAIVTLLAGLPQLAIAAPPPPLPAASATPGAPTPVAVLWMGEVEDDLAQRVVDEVNSALGRRQTVRPIDGVDMRHALVVGGPTTQLSQQLNAARLALARGKLAEAATAFEGAEATLLKEVPFEAMRRELGVVELGLLTTYDQLGRNDDATRAAQRLLMAPGSPAEARVLLTRHALASIFGPSLPPTQIVSQPPGAQVYRDLQPIGASPVAVEGGERAFDFVDVEAPGFRRAHVALGGTGGQLEIALVPEDRLGVAVDHIRDQAPDAPAAEVAALGKRVGADRVLALLPDGPRKLLARWLDVGKAQWSTASLRVDNAGIVAMERLAGFADPQGPSGDGAALPAPTTAQPPPQPKKKLGMWGKWYTWVAAGGVAALVIGLLVAQNVGDDKVILKTSH